MSILATNPLPVRPAQPLHWQAEIKHAIRDPAELAELLDLPKNWAEQARQAARQFPLLAPRPYVARMRKGDPHDPLLRQILPLAREMAPQPGFTTDPVGDNAAQTAPGLLHKYSGRALLITTGACAVHCRYCFRRHYPYAESPKGIAAWQPALQAIASDPTLEEIILSGGDPLTLVDATLKQLVTQLAEIPHVQRLRVHTRLPIVIPARVTTELLDWLTGTRLTPIVVLHANHANELDSEVAAALGRLSDQAIPLLNQAVLLRGVNDSTPAQFQLCQRLVNHRVMPYYLHQLDQVSGAAHFECEPAVGVRIIKELQTMLPGYATPRYVQEIAGERSKTPLSGMIADDRCET